METLLASPHYGERWADWLDLVRYADSGGFEFDVDRAEAWRYRDYVVRSFNSDKPYSQFIKEQIAGDEYAPGNEDAVIATGFLRLGEGGGANADARTRSRMLWQPTTLTFTGRCHNHKFDPIPQKDYYRIQSVFFSTRNVEHRCCRHTRSRRTRRPRRRLIRSCAHCARRSANSKRLI